MLQKRRVSGVPISRVLMSSASEEGWQERVWGVLRGRSPEPTQRAVSLPRLLHLDVSPIVYIPAVTCD